MWVRCRLVWSLPRPLLFPAVLRLCVRRLLVVGVLAWGLVRVCVIGALGVVSGGGVVARLWAGVVGRVRALVSGVGAWGLVLAGLVGVVVLVSVLVLVG